MKLSKSKFEITLKAKNFEWHTPYCLCFIDIDIGLKPVIDIVPARQAITLVFG